MRQRRVSAPAFFLLALALASLPAQAQLAPLHLDRGATGLGLALRRLPVAARVKGQGSPCSPLHANVKYLLLEAA